MIALFLKYMIIKFGGSTFDRANKEHGIAGGSINGSTTFLALVME